MKKLMERSFCCQYSCFPVSRPPGWGRRGGLDHRNFRHGCSCNTAQRNSDKEFGNISGTIAQLRERMTNKWLFQWSSSHLSDGWIWICGARFFCAGFSTSSKTFKVSFCMEKSLGSDSGQLSRPFQFYWSAVSELSVLVLTWCGCCSVGGSVSWSSHWCLVAQRSAGCDPDTVPPWSRASPETTRVQFRLGPGCCRRGRGTPIQGPCVQKRNLRMCSH